MSSNLPVITLGNVVPGAKLLGADETGVNETFVGLAQMPEETCRVYIKVLSDKQLVNELVACVLGRALDFPILEGFLLRARAEDLPESKRLAASPDRENYVFGSKALDAPTLMRHVNLDIEAAVRFLQEHRFEHWDDVMIFDDWIANGDRHGGNLLVAPDSKVFWIDHSHCFTSCDWASEDLNPQNPHLNQVAEVVCLALTPAKKKRLVERARELALFLDMLPLQDALSASHAIHFLSDSDADALVHFVQERVNFLSDLMRHHIGMPLQGEMDFT